MLRRRPGRGPPDASQLRERGAPPHHRLRRGGDRGAGGVAGQGQSVEIQASAGRGGRLDRRPRHLPGGGQAAQLRVPAGGRPPPAPHQHVRRRHPGAALPVAWRCTASSTSGASSGSTRRSSRPTTPRAPEPCSGCRRSTWPTCRAGRPSTSREDFFGREAHLTVSGQLNVEAYCLAMSKVYTFGPTFRAENSNTARHLAEFWMVEPEIAFADLSDDADLAEACLKYIFRAVLDERADDMAFFAERIDEGCIARLEALVDSTLRADGLRRRHRRPAEGGRGRRQLRVPGGVGRRPPVGARALPDRGARRPAGDRHELPQGDQGLLHAPERRRAHGGGHGRARPGHRRDHRRQPAGGAPRRARPAHRRARPRPRGLLVVPGPAPLRHRPPRRLRPRLRADDHLRHRHGQHPRRDPLPAHARRTPTSRVFGCRSHHLLPSHRPPHRADLHPVRPAGLPRPACARLRSGRTASSAYGRPVRRRSSGCPRGRRLGRRATGHQGDHRPQPRGLRPDRDQRRQPERRGWAGPGRAGPVRAGHPVRRVVAAVPARDRRVPPLRARSTSASTW